MDVRPGTTVSPAQIDPMLLLQLQRYPPQDNAALRNLSSGTREKAGQDSRALDNMATEFESVFLSHLLKEMRQTLGPESIFGEDKTGVLGGVFDLYLGQHLAQQQTFGIATLVKKHLANRRANGEPVPQDGLRGRP